VRTISFSIPGDPVAKARARATMIAGRAQMYTPKKTENYEARVAVFAKAALADDRPLDGAVALSIVAWFPIPTSWSKKRRQAALDGREQHTKRPDLDNVLKAIKDGLNGIVWRDDSQVVRLLDCGKRYGDQPRVDVIVAEVA
jgi:Holliday junction resolvase RusA-like endonuclease